MSTAFRRLSSSSDSTTTNVSAVLFSPVNLCIEESANSEEENTSFDRKKIHAAGNVWSFSPSK